MVDKELLGTEFTFVTYASKELPKVKYKCFVAQADPNIGITAKPIDPEEMVRDGFMSDSRGEMNAICLTTETTTPVTGSFAGEYELLKKEMLAGEVPSTSLRPKEELKDHRGFDIGLCAFQ